MAACLQRDTVRPAVAVARGNAQLKILVEREYDIRVTVKRNDESEAMAVSSIKVLPGMP